MHAFKLTSGGTLPAIELPTIDGATIVLGQAANPDNWALVFIYRGLHCPICNKYLAKLESLYAGFKKAGAEIVAVSGDPLEKAKRMAEANSLNFPIAYNLSIPQMKQLGLYISHPRSPQETDHPFAEPALYAVNTEGKLHLIDISNTPFNRSDLMELLDTVEWVRANNYPIRGTYE